MFLIIAIDLDGQSAWEKNAGGEQEMMESGNKETLEGQTIKRKRKWSDGMNVSTGDAYALCYSIQEICHLADQFILSHYACMRRSSCVTKQTGGCGLC